LAEVIEKGIIISKRRVLTIGGSKAVTLPKRWLDIQKWLGREITELVLIGNEAVVLVPPEKKDLALRILRKIEEALEKAHKEG